MPQHDLTIIGGGPGGYVAAIRAAQLGLNVACIEKETTLGGTCVRVGCIPSKALLESSERFAEARHDLAVHGVKIGKVELDLAAMLKRKDDVVRANTSGVDMLFKKNKVTRYLGHGRISGKVGAGFKIAVEKSAGAAEEIETRKIVIATGSSVFRLPGVEFDGDRIGTSTEALAYSSVPKHLVVIGAGYIGLEMGSVWQRLGSRVTVIEYLDRILPGMDAEIAAAAQKVLQKQGLEFKLKAKVTGARHDAKAKKCVVTVEGQEPIDCNRVLVAVGRVPNTEGLGHESIGLQLDPKGRVPINEHFETAVPGVYAIGDVVRGPMLAHKAEDEGVAVAEIVATGHGHVNYDAIPGVVYTHPEVATVGKSEEELKAAETPYRKGVFQFRANGRARALNQVDGFVKVLAHKETDRVLGVHIIGPRAGDLIAEAVAAMEFGASSEDIARTCHAHPTLAEALKEAALAVDGRAIHA